MMNLSLLGHRDGSLEITWAYDGGQSHRSNGEPTPQCSSIVTMRAFKFRALLVKGGAELELTCS